MVLDENNLRNRIGSRYMSGGSIAAGLETNDRIENYYCIPEAR